MTGLYAPLSPVARWTCPPEPKANIKAKYKPETHLDHPAAAEGTATAALACPHHYHRHEGGGVVAWRDKYKVHPYADHYPMMEGEQFADLVRDITEKGLKTPITVDKDGILLDGRNRLEALERAGIELRSWQIQIYRGDDRVGFIKSANAHRRPLALTFALWHQVPTKPAHLL